jgi:hypothetical protein
MERLEACVVLGQLLFPFSVPLLLCPGFPLVLKSPLIIQTQWQLDRRVFGKSHPHFFPVQSQTIFAMASFKTKFKISENYLQWSYMRVRGAPIPYRFGLCRFSHLNKCRSLLLNKIFTSITSVHTNIA